MSGPSQAHSKADSWCIHPHSGRSTWVQRRNSPQQGKQKVAQSGTSGPASFPSHCCSYKGSRGASAASLYGLGATGDEMPCVMSVLSHICRMQVMWAPSWKQQLKSAHFLIRVTQAQEAPQQSWHSKPPAPVGPGLDRGEGYSQATDKTRGRQERRLRVI